MAKCDLCGKKCSYWTIYHEQDNQFCSDCWKNRQKDIKEFLTKRELEEEKKKSLEKQKEELERKKLPKEVIYLEKKLEFIDKEMSKNAIITIAAILFLIFIPPILFIGWKEYILIEWIAAFVVLITGIVRRITLGYKRAEIKFELSQHKLKT